MKFSMFIQPPRPTPRRTTGVPEPRTRLLPLTWSRMSFTCPPRRCAPDRSAIALLNVHDLAHPHGGGLRVDRRSASRGHLDERGLRELSHRSARRSLGARALDHATTLGHSTVGRKRRVESAGNS